MKKLCTAATFLAVISILSSCSTVDTIPVSQTLETSVVTSVTTAATETETTTSEIIDLRKDSFNKNEISVYHTDFEISDELYSEIMSIINQYGTECSFYMVNLEDNATFGYNSDCYIATASTVKFPFAYYCYREIEKDNYSFDDSLLYKSGYYSGGTGVLKDSGSGRYYSVETLLNYMIHYSDNIAFYMLQDYFGYEGYNEMLSSDGFETYINQTTKWGKISSHALGYYWTQVYSYKDECTEGAVLWDTLVNACSNFLLWPFSEIGCEDYVIAHKSGWASPGYHDSGIVLSEHPFVIVVMTNSEGELRDSSFFYNIVIAINKLHDEYLTYLGQEPSPANNPNPKVTTAPATETTTLADTYDVVVPSEIPAQTSSALITEQTSSSALQELPAITESAESVVPTASETYAVTIPPADISETVS